jgi:hypothetical protein
MVMVRLRPYQGETVKISFVTHQGLLSFSQYIWVFVGLRCHEIINQLKKKKRRNVVLELQACI